MAITFCFLSVLLLIFCYKFYFAFFLLLSFLLDFFTYCLSSLSSLLTFFLLLYLFPFYTSLSSTFFHRITFMSTFSYIFLLPHSVLKCIWRPYDGTLAGNTRFLFEMLWCEGFDFRWGRQTLRYGIQKVREEEEMKVEGEKKKNKNKNKWDNKGEEE